MPDLQVEGAVPEISAAFDAESASCAERFLNRIFEIRRFNKCSANRTCGTNLILGSFIEAGGVWLEVTKAEFAIATHHIAMRTFNSGGLEHAFGFTLAALNAFARIKLPDLAPAAIDSRGTIDQRSNN
jgi:ABC-type arginine transport system permease subunit